MTGVLSGSSRHQAQVDDAWVAQVLRPGDLVVVAQGVGEPTPLLETLVTTPHLPSQVEIFVGLSHTDALTAVEDRSLLSFGAMGPLASLAREDRVSVIPCNFSDVPRLLAARAPGRIVPVLQVSAPDAAGRHSLGVAVDYTYELVGHARAVVAEVNAHLPRTSAPDLLTSDFTATVQTARPLVELPTAPVTPVHRSIAAHVAELVPDGATIQLGIGGVTGAVAEALRAHRDLRVHSTLAGGWLLTLARNGALRPGPNSVVVSEVAGDADLYRFAGTDAVSFRPVSELTNPEVLSGLNRFCAINSALQVDLTGQVNAEAVPTGYVGGIGGQADFLRAAQRTVGGASVILLPATTRSGRSRIVRELQDGTVTTPRSSVDLVVTEHGVADLRGRTLSERGVALASIAAPEHRAALLGDTR